MARVVSLIPPSMPGTKPTTGACLAFALLRQAIPPILSDALVFWFVPPAPCGHLVGSPHSQPRRATPTRLPQFPLRLSHTPTPVHGFVAPSAKHEESKHGKRRTCRNGRRRQRSAAANPLPRHPGQRL